MTQVIIAGPREGETEDDHFIRILYGVYRSKDDQVKSFSELELRMMALEEMDRTIEEDHSDGFDEKGWRLTTKKYNLAESVHKDLELFEYGQSPFPAHIFSFMDSFSVEGKIEGHPAEFTIDFYTKQVRPTRTIAYAQSEDLVRDAVKEIFGLKNSDGEPAYEERAVSRRVLTHFPATQLCSISEGVLVFGGSGKQQNDIVKEFMAICSHYEAFTPERYILRCYDLKIDSNWVHDKAKLKEVVDDAGKRVKEIIEIKAKYAA